MSKNIVEPDGPHMTIWSMCIACWIPKATNSHTGYVILLPLSLQEWLHERASVLPNTYIALIFKYCTPHEVRLWLGYCSQYSD